MYIYYILYIYVKYIYIDLVISENIHMYIYIHMYLYIYIYSTHFRKRCPDARPKWNLWGRFLEPDQLHVGHLQWRSRGASMIPLFHWMVGLYTSSLNTHT